MGEGACRRVGRSACLGASEMVAPHASAKRATDHDSDCRPHFLRAFSANRFFYGIPRARRLTLGFNLSSASRLKSSLYPAPKASGVNASRLNPSQAPFAACRLELLPVDFVHFEGYR
jgi:hypothetical protein